MVSLSLRPGDTLHLEQLSGPGLTEPSELHSLSVCVTLLAVEADLDTKLKDSLLPVWRYLQPKLVYHTPESLASLWTDRPQDTKHTPRPCSGLGC